jgi:hypothetical protein
MPDRFTAKATNACLILSSCGLHLTHVVLSVFPVLQTAPLLMRLCPSQSRGQVHPSAGAVTQALA